MDRQTERQTETESKREGEGHATDRKDICKLHGLKHVSQLQRRLTLTHTQQIKLKLIYVLLISLHAICA